MDFSDVLSQRVHRSRTLLNATTVGVTISIDSGRNVVSPLAWRTASSAPPVDEGEHSCNVSLPTFAKGERSRAVESAVRWLATNACQSWKRMAPYLPSLREALQSSLDAELVHAASRRVRVDVFGQLPSGVELETTGLVVDIFEPVPVSDCKATFDRLTTFARRNDRTMKRVSCHRPHGVHGIHPAEHFLELSARVASFALGVANEISGMDWDANLIEWSPDPLKLLNESSALELLEATCAFDRSIFATPFCVHVQCGSPDICDLNPSVEVVVSAPFDAATLVMISAAITLFLARRTIRGSKVIQLVLAATLGVLIVAAAAAYVILQSVTNTRIGKVGAWSMFALGGVAAVFNGALSAVWHVGVTQLAENSAARMAVVLASAISTAGCHWFFGSHLDGLLNIGVLTSSAALLALACARNIELTSFVCTAIAIAWIVSFSLRQLLRLTVLVYSLRKRATESSASSTTSANHERVTTRQREVVARSATGSVMELNDPEDDNILREKQARQPSARLPGRRTISSTNYETEGQLHTQRALKALAAEVRRHPAKYASRLYCPDAVMRFAGVDADSDGYESDQ